MTHENSDFASNIKHLFTETTPFFGREAEISDLIGMLSDPLCRLLTLVGPGGIGKTQLALQVARQSTNQFPDGIHWINLQVLRVGDSFFQTVCEALGLVFSDDPLTQLACHLQSKQVLLICDNFDHLLDIATFLSDLLMFAPDVKILVTSREALNLHEEWVHHLEGLPVPSLHDIENAQSYPSVELFISTARRASSSFAYEDDPVAVVEICSHTTGIPLAIELAAVWTRTLTCAQIVAEIRRGLDMLYTRARNMPERHRSMRLIFDQTCDMLTEEEAIVFTRLSIFRGGFLKDAAEQVAGATFHVITSLIDKSLVRHDSTGRYRMHELIRQYAAEKLSQTPEAFQALTAQHAIYYMDFLHRYESKLQGGAQKQAIDDLRAELSNIQKAWRWAIDHGDVTLIQRGASAFAGFCEMQSRFRDAADLFEKVAQRLETAILTPEQENTLALIESYQARAFIRVGRLNEAEHIAHECMARYERLGIPPVSGFSTDPKFVLGILSLIRGNYREALEYGLNVRQTSERFNHHFNQQLAYYLMAEAAIGLGDFENAKIYAEKTLLLLTEMDNPWSMAYTYNQLGRIARLQTDYVTSIQNYQNSFKIRETFNDQEGMAQALSLIGEITLLYDGYDAAKGYFEKSLAIYRVIGDEGGLAKVLSSSAFAMITDQNYDAAQELLKEALEIAAKLQFVYVAFLILLNVAELLICTGEKKRASDFLALVAHHPAASQEILAVVQRIVERHKVELPIAHDEAELESVIANLLSSFPWVNVTAEIKSIPKFKQSLIEPLTGREQEVLFYIAQGQSNRQIAETMVVSVSTVKSHINNLYGKLAAEDRDDAIKRAQELGLL